MTKIDIYSGFLGAGKTTLIRKMLKEAYNKEQVVLIENEFGEIGIDGGFLKDAGVQITEMNSGCICCSLVGDFSRALLSVMKEYKPDRIIIEPSGVGKLSDVIKAVRNTDSDEAILNSFTTVVDVNKCKMYMKNFGEFFNNQIENASAIVLSHTDKASDERIKECIELIRKYNKDAVIISTSVSKLSGEQILSAIEQKNTLKSELEKLKEEEICPVCGHHHVHHHHDDENDDDEYDDYEHDDDEECECHHMHHRHDNDDDNDECECSHENHNQHDHHDNHAPHDHHHGHHADEIFVSIGKETANRYDKEHMREMLLELQNSDKYGVILGAKGVVASSQNDSWIHFDYVPGEADVRDGSADVIGRICIIGSEINEKAISDLFGI